MLHKLVILTHGPPQTVPLSFSHRQGVPLCAMSMQNMLIRPEFCWKIGIWRCCVRHRGCFAPILAGKSEISKFTQKTSAPGLKLLLHRWFILWCQILRGELRGCRGGGTTCTLQALMEGFALLASH